MGLIVPKSVIGGEPITVESLLKTKNSIPTYQRDYVWQEKSVRELWRDLLDHYERNAVNEQLPGPEGYFLGAMVVIENEPDFSLEIVDGQQRITTLSTIVSVLYDRVDSLPADHPSKTGFETRLRSMLGTFDGVAWKANLEFSDVDLHDFYLKSCVLKRSLTDKQTYWALPELQPKIMRKRSPIARMKQAIESGYEVLDKFLNDQTDPALRELRLISLIRLITEAVVVLRITARSYSNAYSIFESLNNRGVPLSQADLIKNELLKIAPESDRDEITENWAWVRQTVDTFDVVQLPDLIHYSYLSRFGYTKAKDLYSVVKGAIGNHQTNPKQYSIDLYEDAAALDALSENFKAAWTTDTINMLKDIKHVLGVKLCYPFLMAAYRKHSGDAGVFEDHVRAVMNFAFRYMKVLEGSVEGLAVAISNAARFINEGGSTEKILTEFREKAPDTEFAKEFETISFQSAKLSYFIIYYLEKVQVMGVIPVLHGEEQNLEHIMPKNPKDTQWPVIAAQKAANPEAFKDYLWRVGNLLPLPASINKSIKNREIAYKINNATGNHYNAPGLGLESPKKVVGFLDGGQWTYKSIEDRQKHLAHTYAVSAWKL